jgi:hypothetical protein
MHVIRVTRDPLFMRISLTTGHLRRIVAGLCPIARLPNGRTCRIVAGLCPIARLPNGRTGRIVAGLGSHE